MEKRERYPMSKASLRQKLNYEYLKTESQVTYLASLKHISFIIKLSMSNQNLSTSLLKVGAGFAGCALHFKTISPPQSHFLAPL